MSIAGFTLFNFVYGVVNLMVNAQTGFHKRHGQPGLNPVKFVINHEATIKRGYHLFFYTGGLLLIAIAFWKY